MRFRVIIQQSGKATTGMIIPPEVLEALGSGKRPAVRVTVGGHTYRSTVGVMGGLFMLPLSAENRAAAGVQGGDEVDVDLEIDDQPREATVPPDLSSALDQDVQAKKFFESLTFSQQMIFVTWIEQAKKAETREQRVAKSISSLRDGSKRP